MSKVNIRKGDNVYVLSGEDRGKTGRVLKVDAKKSRVLVEGVNFVMKAMKPNAKHPQGGLVKMEAPIHISKVNLIDPKSGKPTRIGRKKNSEGKSVRYSKRSGEEIK